MLRSQGAFEIIENGQKVANEDFFLNCGLSLGIAPGALLEVVEISSETQVIVLLRGQLLLEYDKITRRNRNDSNRRIWHIGCRAERIVGQGLRLGAL